ncbi:MAG TPA: PAS domain S-box protein, partial [Bacteroidota bacterium]|nr:PAS domain S-box protein [Bacteroidota bacterium]
MSIRKGKRKKKTSATGPQLSLNEELFRLISENAEDLIAVTDVSGKRVYASASYKSVLGRDVDALLGTDAFAEIHPEDRDRIKSLFEETVKTGKGARAEYRFVTEDGGIRYIESRGNAYRDTDGKVSGVVVISRDVTERRNYESRLRLLAHALSSTRDCFYLTDLKGKILLVNNSLFKTYGYSEEELVGADIALIHASANSRELISQIVPLTLKGGWHGELVDR